MRGDLSGLGSRERNFGGAESPAGVSEPGGERIKLCRRLCVVEAELTPLAARASR